MATAKKAPAKAPAKKAAAKAAPAKAPAKKAAAPKAAAKRAPNPAFMKALTPSAELAKVRIPDSREIGREIGGVEIRLVVDVRPVDVRR